jgi:hypothetical protein
LHGARPGLPVVSLLNGPLLLQQQAEVLVRERRLRIAPGTPVSAAVSVTPNRYYVGCIIYV